MADRCHRHHFGLVALLLVAAGVAQAQAPQPPLRSTACPPPTRTTAAAARDPTSSAARRWAYAVHLDAGFRCLCAAAAEPQLVIGGGRNSTRVLALYASCGGRRPVDSRVATACGVMAETGDMSEAACDPVNLADQVARLRSTACPPPTRTTAAAARDPTSSAARRWAYAVHLDAGFRCLCAAAAEPQLVIGGGRNSTRVLALYASCGGRRPVDSRVATACGVMAETGDMSEAACDPVNLADQVARYCRTDAPTAECCEPVVASVDLAGGDPSCLCRVLADPQLAAAGANNATALLAMYTACGGLRAVGPDIADGCIHPRTPSTPPAPVIISAGRPSP
ncbi:hypothetical protein OsJ_18229 [Oryza sativa Japonica Group]|uniref:Bifunctional inhibitor/plant lipid transfer protein/seed storage helical domain-containing protein n=1 Tax=Oryza sativa subsp. japonica TaxID=39947 RepID=B9FP54_ORYSJ|nr:hypothetical protein OsJ_18229 [Oryza sativa Japonica Group]